MALKELQEALAEIFTSESARNKFFANKKAWANKKIALGDSDKKYLVSLNKERVQHYAQSLFWKRYTNICDMLPLFAEYTDREALINIFKKYLEDEKLINSNYHDYRSHFVRDVVCFCRYLMENKSDFPKGSEWLADLAHYESERLNDKISLVPLNIIVKRLNSEPIDKKQGS